MSLIALILSAEEPNQAILPGDLNEVWWGSVATLLLLIAFLWKGLPVVRRMARQRTERIADELAAAERVRADAEAQLAELRATLANAEEESRRIVADATERAEVLKAELMSRYEAEIQESVDRARIEVEAARSQALVDVREEVVALTVRATEVVVQEMLDDTSHRSLIESYIEQVGAAR